MSYSLNRVQLIGNLTKDPETVSTNSGNVVKFSVATNRRVKSRDSEEYKDIPQFHNIVCFGKVAEIAEKYLSKGIKVFCEGYLNTQSWEDKDSHQKKYKTEIVLQQLIILTPKKSDGNVEPAEHEERPFKKDSKAPSEEKGSTVYQEDVNIDDLPF